MCKSALWNWSTRVDHESVEGDPMDGRYRGAKAQVEALRGFYGHATAYALVNAGLLLINLLTSPAYLWVVWPLLGWGIGLASHALGVFGGRFGRDSKERQLRRLIDERERRPRDEPPAETWPNLST